MSRRLPSFRSIEAFVSVAENLSFRHAAEQLNVSISAISHRIRVLEEELGVELLDRSARNIRLTRAGSTYLAGLRPALAGLLEATNLTRGNGGKSVISLAAPPMLLDQWLLRRLADFTDIYPQADIELVSLGRKKAASCAIKIAPISPGKSKKDVLHFMDLVVSPVCSSDYARQYELCEPHDLLRARLIEVPGLKGWELWFDACALPWGLELPSMLIDDPVLVYRAAALGLGVALGAQILTDDQVANGELIRPFDIACRLPTPLSIQVLDQSSDLVHAFVEWLMKAIDE